MKKLINILFVIYVIALFKITVFRDGFEIAGAFNYGKVNFIPFTDLFRIAGRRSKIFYLPVRRQYSLVRADRVLYVRV